MGQRYEIMISVFLRDDTPVGVVGELRWQLGLSPERPAGCALNVDEPQLLPRPGSDLPGGDVATLTRQRRSIHRGVDHHAWGLHARLSWTDDQWANRWLQVAGWLAPFAEPDGYAGFFREESEDTPTLLLYRRGVAYLCAFGEQPVPLSP